MFTDINYVLDNYRCKNMGVFYASLIIMSITMCFNMIILFTFLLKIFWKKPSNRSSTSYINIYSKMCFAVEMFGLGRVLDKVIKIILIFFKFSTSSATKFSFFLLPDSLRNVYIPLIIISTF